MSKEVEDGDESENEGCKTDGDRGVEMRFGHVNVAGNRTWADRGLTFWWTRCC